MYQPAHFREERMDVVRELMDRHPLAALITTGADGLTADHIPLLYDPKPTPYGTLLGHVSRANPLWQNHDGAHALAIFQGPEAYISPNWYPTKMATARAVPTWNYAVVHASGKLATYSDPARLRAFLDRLTAVHEASEPQPWKPSDAPPEYIEGLLKAIVGIELTIAKIEGKWKVSQNQPVENQRGAADELAARGDAVMSALIRNGYTSPGS